MTAQTRSSRGECLQLKEEGNAHLKSKQYGHALRCYKEALIRFDEMVERDQIQTEEAMLEQITKVPCMKNICMCDLKLKKFKECVEHCDEVLELEPECLKTLYRKAMALMELGDLNQAEQILKKCYFSNPTEAEIQKSLAEVESRRHAIVDDEQRRKQADNSLICRLLRLLLWLLIPLNFFCNLVLKRDIPFYRTAKDWANGKKLKPQ